MCIHPVDLGDGLRVECRKCWQCRSDRVNDYVGRCLAESKVSDATIALTLTYAEDAPSSATLIYRDVQLFLKRLRRRKFKVRYIVAGEYGSKKGRAHWHCVLFFRGKVPDLPLEERTYWDAWPHGFVFAQHPDYGGLRYVLKYVLKDTNDDLASSHLAMSKQPPLGDQYIRALARRYVDQGVSPQHYKYWFDDEFSPDGKRRKFRLRGVSRDNFIREYLDYWAVTHAGRDYPLSEIVEAYEDTQVRLYADMTDDEWRARLQKRAFFVPPDAGGGQVDCLVGDYQGVPVFIMDNDDGTARIYYQTEDGEKSWHEKDRKVLASIRRSLKNPRVFVLQGHVHR